MHTKSRLVGERCDRKLGRVHGCAGWVAADLAFCRHVLVRAAGFRGACGTDEENGPGTREICGVLLLEVFGGGDRDWLADVPFFALRATSLARNDGDLSATESNIFPVARKLHLI